MAISIAKFIPVRTMATYSIADAKNRLPKLIDRALDGEEVMITRHGKAVAELRPALSRPAAPTGTYTWLRERRRRRRGVGLTSVQILDRIYEADER
jgi:prevent-host-death family protein